MPAAAVASLTPAISGMAGTSVGASGETEGDMGFPAGRAKGSALYHLRWRAGRGQCPHKPVVPANAVTHKHRGFVVERDAATACPSPQPVVMGPGFRRGNTELLLRRRRHLAIGGGWRA